MAGSKDRTAIFIRQNRRFERVDFARDLHDFLLVHTNAGAEHGNIGKGGVGDRQSLCGLACHLAKGFARHKRTGSNVLCASLCQHHHKAAQKQGEIIFIAGFHQLLLRFRQRNNVHVDAAAIGAQLLCKCEHLIERKPRRIGGRFIVNGLQLHTALGHHKACNGAVDTAAEKQKTFACRTDGKAACAVFLRGVHVGISVAHFHADHRFGIVQIHFASANGSEQHTAHLCGNLRRLQRERFIGSFSIHTKPLDTRHFRGQIGARRFADGFHILFAFCRAADLDDAKNLFCGIIHTVEIARVLLRHDIHGALHHRHLEFAIRSASAAQGAQQSRLKLIAVRTLEHDLAKLAQDNFFHKSTLILLI